MVSISISMLGVLIVEGSAFVIVNCEALMHAECGKLKRIGYEAFLSCKSLKSIEEHRLATSCSCWGLTVHLVTVKTWRTRNSIKSWKELRLRVRHSKTAKISGTNYYLSHWKIDWDNAFMCCEHLNHVLRSGWRRITWGDGHFKYGELQKLAIHYASYQYQLA